MLKNPYISRLLKNVPLKVVLVVPFIIQICVATGIVGIFTYRNSQQAISTMAEILSGEMSDRISAEIKNYLELPSQINQSNVDAIEMGILNIKDFQLIEKYFWKQINLYKVSAINIAFNSRELIGVERKDNGQIIINEILIERGINKIARFATDSQGNRQNPASIMDMTRDIRQEDWYTSAVKAGKPTWTTISQLENQPEVLSISHSYPLYNRERQLMGVIEVEYALTQLNTFLRNLKVSEKSSVFVIERSGLVVGTSTNDKILTFVNGIPQRLNILASQDTTSVTSAKYLIQHYGKFDMIQGVGHLEQVVDGETHFIHVQNWRDKHGLDWLIVIVIPESQFTVPFRERTQIVILLCYAVLAIAILMGMLTARSITSALQKLSEAAIAITQGKTDTRVTIAGTSEIQTLAQSFNTMAEMVANSFRQLATSNQELELRVQERTFELNASKASLQRINFLLNRRENQLRKQQDCLLSLTKDKSINQGDFIGAVQNITYTGSHALNVERVSIWLFDTAKTLLHCLDLYIKSIDIHTEADFLTAQEYPKFFEAIQVQHSMSFEDVQEEEILQEMLASYFHPANTVSLLIKTFEVNGELTGIISFEHTEVERLWIPEEHSFANSLADLLALGMESQERRRAEEKLRIEQMKSERLLLNVLPQEIVERLKLSQLKGGANKVVEPFSNEPLDLSSDPMLETLTNGKISGAIVADAFEEVTVLFADIVNFTEYAASISASDLVNCLNEIFSEFDRLVDIYDLEKIKTIGDSYMAVGGLPTPSKDHAEAIAEMALEMQTSIQQFIRADGSPFSLRIGIHTGQAIAGVIGTKKFIYDLWGDTVNVASRMESQGVAGCIQVTEVTYHLLKGKYQFESRREIDIKGKGKMITYLLTGRLLS